MADVRVDIPGIGAVLAENAATESTLQEILKALKKGGGAGAGGAGGGGAGGGVGGAAGQAAGAVDDLGNKAKEGADEVGMLGMAAAEAEQALQSLVLGGIGAAIGGAMSFGKELLTGGNRLSDLASAVPLVGDYLGVLAGVLDNQIDSFRAVASSGASFGNDMFEMSKVAGSAGMSLERFTGFVQENAKTMSLFGSSTTEGTKRFLGISKALRTGAIGEQLMGMGFTMDTINEGFATYSEEMARSGRLEKMSNAELVAGSQNYLKEMDKLAKITGLNRQELEKAREQAMTDARTRLHANSLEGEARDNFLNNMSMLNTTMPGMATAFDDLRDGVAQTDEGIALVNAVGDKAYEVANALAEGVDPAQLNNMLADMGPELDNFFGKFDQAALQALEQTNPALYAIASATGQINRLTKKSEADIEAEQKQAAKFTTIMGGIEQAIEGFRGKLKEYFLDSPLFEQLTGMFDGLGTSGSFLDDVFEKMKPTLDKVFTSLSNFITSFMADPGKAMSDLGDSIMGWLGDGIKALFSSFLPSLDTVLVGAVAGIATLIFAPVAAPFLAIGAALLAMFGYETIKGWVSAGIDAIIGLGTAIMDLFTWEGISGFFTDAWDAIMAVPNAIIGLFKGETNFGDVIGAAWDAIMFVPNKILGIFDTSVGDLFQKAKDMIMWPINKIKEVFGIEFEFPSLTDMFSSIVDKVKGFFSFDFKLPNFKDYLPKWLGGKGKSLFGGGDDSEDVASADTDEPNAYDKKMAKMEAKKNKMRSADETTDAIVPTSQEDIANMAVNMADASTAMSELSGKLSGLTDLGSSQKKTNEQLESLNTSMAQIAQLMIENNKLTKGVETGVNNQGDLMTG